jgi:phosphatidate cytidylyltransferase
MAVINMAFNWSTFKTRSLTALVFVLIMLTGLLWNHWSFFVLFSIIHFGCWWEYFKLTEKIHQTSFHIYTKLGMMLAGFGIMLWLSGPAYHFHQYSFKDNFSMPVSAAGFILMIIGVLRGDAVNVKGYGMAGLGILYISLSWGMMIDLNGIILTREMPGNYLHDVVFSAVAVFIFTIWINDTMAYIVGSFIGKTALSVISPKKTWEGTIGGVVLAVALMAVLIFKVFEFAEAAEWYHWLIIPLIAAIAGTFGDLLESKLKRMAGVKDSGSLMPGHGGFLDRFDSLLLATPAVWLYVLIFMR